MPTNLDGVRCYDTCGSVVREIVLESIGHGHEPGITQAADMLIGLLPEDSVFLEY